MGVFRAFGLAGEDLVLIEGLVSGGDVHKGNAGVGRRLGFADEGIAQVDLIVHAALRVDQNAAVRLKVHVIAVHVLGDQIVVRVEPVVKERAGGPDQAAARGHEAPEVFRKADHAEGAGLKRELHDGVIHQEDHAAAVHHVELAELAAEIIQIDGLGPGGDVIADQVKAAVVQTGHIEHAVNVVQAGGLLRVDGGSSAVRLIYVSVVTDVEQAVLRLDPASAGKHIAGEGAEGAERIGSVGRPDQRHGADQHQDRQRQSGQSVEQIFHRASSKLCKPIGPDGYR